VMEGLYVSDLLMFVLLNISNVSYRYFASKQAQINLVNIHFKSRTRKKEKDLSKEGNNSDYRFLIVPIIKNLHWMAHQIPGLVVSTISHNGSSC
jgi:hypothetical protein